jgi:hypothetical protein
MLMLLVMCVAVVMHKDKEDGMHHETQFRNRDLTTYDHTLLDGEMFLQVSSDCHASPCGLRSLPFHHRQSPFAAKAYANQHTSIEYLFFCPSM